MITRIRCRVSLTAALALVAGGLCSADDLAPPPADLSPPLQRADDADPVPAETTPVTDEPSADAPTAAPPFQPAEPMPPAATSPPSVVAAIAAPTPTLPPPAADGTASVMVAPPPGLTAEPALTSVPKAGPTRAADPNPALPPPSPPATSEPPAAVGVAPALLADLLEPEAGGTAAAAYARPLTLLEALQRAGDPSRRLWIVQAYWKTALAFAAVHSCRAAGQRIDLIAPGGDPHDRAVLDVAAAAARADVAEAIALVGTAQQELADLARLPLNEPPPWPVDRPLATPYQTHFETLFATRIATGRVRAIARTLPARHEALEARAQAVRAASDALAMAESDHAKGRRPIEAVVAAHAALVGQEREFLRATRAYNTDIAEYAMAVADLSLPEPAFVAMLIGTVAPPAAPPIPPLIAPAAPPIPSSIPPAATPTVPVAPGAFGALP
jgi:hypothetical protein